MAVFETVLKSDLKKPLIVQQLSGSMFTGDNNSNIITAEVTDGGQPAALTGVVSAYIVRPDEATVYVTGTLDGNRASVIMPASVYTNVGTISIVLKVGTTTVAACTSYVYRTSTDEIIDPGHVIPSLEELLAQIEYARAAGDYASQKGMYANEEGDYAKEQGDIAKAKGNTAEQQGNTAQGQGNTAEQQGDYAAEQGDYAKAQGEGVDVDSITVSWADSTSGTVIPTTWQSAIPPIVRGHFLWSRTDVTYHSGTVVTTYSVAHQGLNGEGTSYVEGDTLFIFNG